ncbi:maestro heat-like repeat-containing protein family member 7 [Talpa occidentalis]|uniref:maestro heat-like repeat-containing protein family member 7 n=1 Tax=Talpa occidentalis TaxID=50954 RepID=UPI0023F9DD64|nr:maestro heat-like repeat-containing protein family member 7 [Talpa occidentalis]
MWKISGIHSKLRFRKSSSDDRPIVYHPEQAKRVTYQDYHLLDCFLNQFSSSPHSTGMLIATIASPETTHRDLAWDVSEKTIENFNDALQVSGQLSADAILQTSQDAEIKIYEGATAETPPFIPFSLQLLDTWLNSQKDSERERAMWCTARILGFIAKMKDFDNKIEFTRLGRLVRLLAMRCQDPVDNICFLSAQAVYNLYCILLRQKQMARKKEGLWEEDSKSGIYSAHVFYNSTFEIAKAFAEYFTKIQVTTLVLTAIEGLTDSRAKVSLALAQLMSAVLKERGKDVIKIEEVVEGILERLNSQLEPNTKEETLQAMCWLAGSNTHTVVPMLLNKPLPWDRTILNVWKAFGTLRESTISILLLLISILEKPHPKEETLEMAFQSVAVACALCEMFSGSLCQEVIQEFYPRLLLAVLYHLHWVIEQNAAQKMVVYNKEGYLGSKSNSLDPTSCALEVVKLVILAAAYDGVVNYADLHHSWDLLSSPSLYHIGIMDLTSGIVISCEPAVLHRILNLVRNLLYNPDNHWKILARAFYAQLLWHRSVAQTLGQEFLGNLVKWIKEPNLTMKEIGLRGIGNLALHPKQSESLQSLAPFLRNFLKSEVRVTVQAVKTLRNIICHGKGMEAKVVFCSISKQLRPLINDERDEVRIAATSALGHMLRQVGKFKPGSSIQKEIYTFLVPLLLSIQDTNIEVIKACGGALTEWTKVIVWSSLTEAFRHTTLSDHIHVLEETCKYLVGTGKLQLVGDLLSQSFDFLKSPQFFLRAAALNFIGFTVKRLNMKLIHPKDVQLLRSVLTSLNNDPMEDIPILAHNVLKAIEDSLASGYASTSRLTQLSRHFFKWSCLKHTERKKRLFKTVKREKAESDQKRTAPTWLQSPLASLRNWYKSL